MSNKDYYNFKENAGRPPKPKQFSTRFADPYRISERPPGRPENQNDKDNLWQMEDDGLANDFRFNQLSSTDPTVLPPWYNYEFSDWENGLGMEWMNQETWTNIEPIFIWTDPVFEYVWQNLDPITVGGDGWNWEDFNWQDLPWSEVDWTTVDFTDFPWEIINWQDFPWQDYDWSDPIWQEFPWQDVDWGDPVWNEYPWEDIPWQNIPWEEVPWNTVDWDTFPWDDIPWNQVPWDGINWNDFPFDNINWNDLVTAAPPPPSLNFNNPPFASKNLKDFEWGNPGWNDFVFTPSPGTGTSISPPPGQGTGATDFNWNDPKWNDIPNYPNKWTNPEWSDFSPPSFDPDAGSVEEWIINKFSPPAIPQTTGDSGSEAIPPAQLDLPFAQIKFPDENTVTRTPAGYPTPYAIPSVAPIKVQRGQQASMYFYVKLVNDQGEEEPINYNVTIPFEFEGNAVRGEDYTVFFGNEETFTNVVGIGNVIYIPKGETKAEIRCRIEDGKPEQQEETLSITLRLLKGSSHLMPAYNEYGDGQVDSRGNVSFPVLYRVPAETDATEEELKASIAEKQATLESLSSEWNSAKGVTANRYDLLREAETTLSNAQRSYQQSPAGETRELAKDAVDNAYAAYQTAIANVNSALASEQSTYDQRQNVINEIKVLQEELLTAEQRGVEPRGTATGYIVPRLVTAQLSITSPEQPPEDWEGSEDDQVLTRGNNTPASLMVKFMADASAGFSQFKVTCRIECDGSASGAQGGDNVGDYYIPPTEGGEYFLTEDQLTFVADRSRFAAPEGSEEGTPGEYVVTVPIYAVINGNIEEGNVMPFVLSPMPARETIWFAQEDNPDSSNYWETADPATLHIITARSEVEAELTVISPYTHEFPEGEEDDGIARIPEGFEHPLVTRLTLSYGNKTAAPNPGFLSKAFTLLIGLGGEATPLTDYDFDRKEYVSDQENDYGPLVGISYKEDDQQLAVDIPEGLINGEVSTLTIDIPVNALEDDEDEAGTDEKGESLTFTPVGELELIKGNIVAISTGGGEQQVKWKTLEAVLTYIIDVIENLTCLFKVVLPGGKIQGFYADEDLPLVGYEPIAISVQGIDDYSALLQNGNSYAFVKNGEYVVKELNGYICPLGTELVLQVEEVVNGSLDGDAIKTDLPNEFKRSVSETLPSISSMRGLLLSQSSIPTITTTLRVVGANTETEFSTSYLQVSSGAKRVAATLPWIKNNGASPSPTFFLYIAELLSNGWEQHYSIDRYSGRNGCAIYTHVVIQDRRNNFHKSGDSIDKLRINVEIENQTYRITESLDNDNEHFYAVFESQGALSEGNNTLETASGFFPNISSWVDQPGRFYSIDSLDQANWLEIDALTVRFGISNTGFFSNIPGEYNQASAERLSNARSGYLEPPTSVYVYEIKNGIAKRWDGTVTNYNFSVTPNDNFRILVDAVRQPSSCSVELSNPQEPEFHAWGNIFPDCVVIEPRSNSTLSIVDYSFIPKDLGNANVNIYLYDVVEGDSSYRTMEIAVGQRVPGAQEEKEEWLADRYRFNIEELKWERLPNMKGKLSPVTEETDYVAPYPIPEKEAPESP